MPALSGGLCKLYRKGISPSGRKSSLKVPTDWYHQCYVGAPHRWRLFCFNHLILNTDKSVGGQSGWPLTISHRVLNGDIMVQRCILSLFPFGSPPIPLYCQDPSTPGSTLARVIVYFFEKLTRVLTGSVKEQGQILISLHRSSRVVFGFFFFVQRFA